jgi:kynureninase
MTYENTLDFARRQDAEDPLRQFRERFLFPQHDGRDVRYFCGNSLGLQPVGVRASIAQELDDWAHLGVEGHFRGTHPWLSYHRMFAEPLARLTGARPHEVVAMNSLTVNLHLMMVSFYRPTKQRFKIICEAGAFPSDQYALEMQVRFHGFDPDEAIIELTPRSGEHTLRTEDIINTIIANADELALLMMPGVQYYTGQVFDMKTMAAEAHAVGALVGYDLAHAMGNVELHLHDWDVDFAVWCSYKYLNAGPGGVSGAFVHERHASNPALPRFAGWWGNDEKQRFLMKKGFHPAYGADGWQISNAPVLSMAALKASLDIFDEAGMPALAAKRDKLTGFLAFVIDEAGKNNAGHRFEVITPNNPEERGCQISLLTDSNGRNLFDKLTAEGIIADWREPNVIRVAPVPLYNSFEDVWHLGQMLQQR